MSPARAAAIVPNALSFPRATMRELVRGRWRIEKLRFDLDAEGRGEILYRLVPAARAGHFTSSSSPLKLPEAQKTDRNWAQSWDAMGVLCQGEWTTEREALPARARCRSNGLATPTTARSSTRAAIAARALFDARRREPGRRAASPMLALVAPRRLHPAHHGVHRQRPARHAAATRASSPTIRFGVRTTRRSARRSCCANTCSTSSTTWRARATRARRASRRPTGATSGSAMPRRPGWSRSSPTIRTSCTSGAWRTKRRSPRPSAAAPDLATRRRDALRAAARQGDPLPRAKAKRRTTACSRRRRRGGRARARARGVRRCRRAMPRGPALLQWAERHVCSATRAKCSTRSCSSSIPTSWRPRQTLPRRRALRGPAGDDGGGAARARARRLRLGAADAYRDAAPRTTSGTARHRRRATCAAASAASRGARVRRPRWIPC